MEKKKALEIVGVKIVYLRDGYTYFMCGEKVVIGSKRHERLIQEFGQEGLEAKILDKGEKPSAGKWLKRTAVLVEVEEAPKEEVAKEE